MVALDGPCHKTSAAERLWPRDDSAAALVRLRNVLARLNAGNRIVDSDAAYLRLRDNALVDVAWFEHCASTALHAPESPVREDYAWAAIEVYDRVLDEIDELSLLEPHLVALH